EIYNSGYVVGGAAAFGSNSAAAHGDAIASAQIIQTEIARAVGLYADAHGGLTNDEAVIAYATARGSQSASADASGSATALATDESDASALGLHVNGWLDNSGAIAAIAKATSHAKAAADAEIGQAAAHAYADA